MTTASEILDEIRPVLIRMAKETIERTLELADRVTIAPATLDSTWTDDAGVTRGAVRFDEPGVESGTLEVEIIGLVPVNGSRVFVLHVPPSGVYCLGTPGGLVAP